MLNFRDLRPSQSVTNVPTGPLFAEIYNSKEEVASQLSVASQIIAAQIKEQGLESKSLEAMTFHPVIMAFPSMKNAVLMVNCDAQTCSSVHDWAQTHQFDPAEIARLIQLLTAPTVSATPSDQVVPATQANLAAQPATSDGSQGDRISTPATQDVSPAAEANITAVPATQVSVTLVAVPPAQVTSAAEANITAVPATQVPVTLVAAPPAQVTSAAEAKITAVPATQVPVTLVAAPAAGVTSAAQHIEASVVIQDVQPHPPALVPVLPPTTGSATAPATGTSTPADTQTAAEMKQLAER